MITEILDSAAEIPLSEIVKCNCAGLRNALLQEVQFLGSIIRRNTNCQHSECREYADYGASASLQQVGKNVSST